jgi:hypothetical protein
MAFFPVSPTDGQQANVGNITYQWSAATGAWNRVGTTVVPLFDQPLVSITGNLLVTGNGTSLFTSAITTNSVLTANTITATGNITGNNINAAGLVSAAGNVHGANIRTSGSATAQNIISNTTISATGNISTLDSVTAINTVQGNLLLSTGDTTVSGNITGGGFVSVAGYVQSSGNISAFGNVTGGNIITTGLITATGNVQGGNLVTAGLVTATGNVTGGNLTTGGLITATGNITTAGLITATGNITSSANVSGTFILGNGAFLTGVQTSGGGGGGTAAYRSNVSVSTGSIANNANYVGSFNGFGGYAVYKVTTSDAAWVRLYTSTTAQTADASRSLYTAPNIGAGVITEVITSSANTILIAPGAIGFTDTPPAAGNVNASVPVTVTNLSGGTANITATVTMLLLEGIALTSRSNVTVYSGSIANNANANVSATIAKSYMLYKVTATANSWVRLYSNVATRTADASRSINTDPGPNAGVMAEIITGTANSIVLISPGAIGWNDESSVSSTIPLAITNLSGATANIAVTFTTVNVEP